MGRGIFCNQISGFLDTKIRIFLSIDLPTFIIYNIYMISYEPLKKILKERSILIKDLASDMEINSIALCNILNGKADAKTDKITAICKILNCDIKDIICYTDKVDKKVSVDWDKLGNAITVSGNSLSGISEDIGKSKSTLVAMKRDNRVIWLSNLDKICSIIKRDSADFLK